MSVVIIDYGSGNLRSVAKAFERAAEGSGQSVTVTTSPAALQTASHIVLPGVGAFADCMAGLSAISGMIDTLDEQVRVRKKPFLGICVGMQMMFERGRENGDHAGLGWIAGEVVAITPKDGTYKIPHMGWNDLSIRRSHPLLHGIKNGEHVYFVHSYHALPREENTILATVEYGTPLTAIITQENMVGTQFHPEKSQETGMKLLRNFLRL